MSPYLKSLSMVAANKLLHLLEAFSTTWFLFSASQNHHLVFFLLEVFNNIIQYQFDGEAPGQALGVGGRNQGGQRARIPSCLRDYSFLPCPQFVQCVLIACCVPCPVLGAADTAENQAECSLPRGSHSWGQRHRGRL